MGTKSLPELTSRQVNELIVTVLQYRDTRTLNFRFGPKYIEIKAFSYTTGAFLGSWSLAYKSSGGIILTTIMNGVRQEGNIAKQMSAIWPTVVHDLHYWSKAINHIELARLPEGSRPTHIIDNSALDPNDYSPLGCK